jgi:hypothetical protein
MQKETSMSNKERFISLVPGMAFGMNAGGPFLHWIMDEEEPVIPDIDIEMVKMDIDRLAALWEDRLFKYVDVQLGSLGLVPYLEFGCELYEVVGGDVGNDMDIQEVVDFEINEVVLNCDILGNLHGKKLENFVVKHFFTIKKHVDELGEKFMSEDLAGYLEAM